MEIKNTRQWKAEAYYVHKHIYNTSAKENPRCVFSKKGENIEDRMGEEKKDGTAGGGHWTVCSNIPFKQILLILSL